MKKILWIFGVLLLMLVLASAVLWWFFPKEKILREIQSRATAAIGKPVAIGDISLELLPPLGIKLSQIKVDTSTIATLYVKLKLLPLLKRQVEVAKVVIDTPNLITQLADPEVAKKLPEPPPSKNSSDSSSNALAIALSDLRIINGHFRLFDAKAKDFQGTPLVELDGIDEQLSAKIQGGETITLSGVLKVAKMHFKLAGNSFGQGLQLKLEKKIVFDLGGDLLKIEQGNLEIGDLPLQLTGEVAKLRSESPIVDLKLKGGPTDIKSILGYLPKALFPQIAGVSSQGRLMLEAYVKGALPNSKSAAAPSNNLDYFAKLDLQDGRLVYPKLKEPVEAITVSVSATPQLINIENFQAKMGTNFLQLRGKIDNYRKQPLLDLALLADLNLAEAMAMQPEASSAPGGKAPLDIKLDGHAKVDLKLVGNPKDLKKMQYKGTIALKSVTLRTPQIPVPIENLNGNVALTEKNLSTEGISGKLQSSNFTLKGNVQDYQSAPKINANIDAKLVLSELVKLIPTPPKAEVGGTVLLKVSAKGGVKELAQLDLAGNLELQNLAYVAVGSDLPPLRQLNGKIDLTKQSILLRGVHGELGSSDFQINGQASHFDALYNTAAKNQTVVFDLSMHNKLLNLDELMPKKKSEEKTDVLTISSLLKKLDGKVSLQADEVKFNKMQPTSVAGIAIIKQGIFNLQNFKLNIFGGGLLLDGKADFTNAENPLFDLGLDVQKMQVAKLLSYSEQLNHFGSLAGYLTGDLSTKMRFQGALDKNLQLDLNKLNANGLLGIAKANLSNHPLQNKIATLLNTPQLKQFSVANWSQALDIQSGKLNIKALKLDVADFKAMINGTQAVDGNINLGVDVDLPPNLAGGIKSLLPEAAADLLFDGSNTSSITVPLLVSGLVTAPNVGVNQQQLNSSVQKLVQTKLKAKAEGLLQQQLGVKPGQPAVKPEQIKKQAQDLINNIFK